MLELRTSWIFCEKIQFIDMNRIASSTSGEKKIRNQEKLREMAYIMKVIMKKRGIRIKTNQQSCFNVIIAIAPSLKWCCFFSMLRIALIQLTWK